MVDIISPRDGPLPQDARAKRFLNDNRQTVRRLADQLTSGGYSAAKQEQARRETEAQAARQIAEMTPALPARARDSGEIAVKVSLNNRVIAYDLGSGRQVALLGEIRREGPHRYFALGSRENGFISPPEAEILAPLQELDGQIIDLNCPETLLAADISRRLAELPAPQND